MLEIIPNTPQPSSGSYVTLPNVTVYSTKPPKPSSESTEVSPLINVASLVNSNTLNTLKSLYDNPKTFGDQLKDQGKQKIIQSIADSTLAKLLREKKDLIETGIKLDIQHRINIEKLEYDHTPKKQFSQSTGQVINIPPKLNDKEYKRQLDIENKNYEDAKKINEDAKEENKKNLDKFLKDPFSKQKEQLKKRKEARVKAKSRTKEEKRKARKERTKAVLQNTKKTLVPILTLLISNRLSEIIAQNDKIRKLVNDTNAIITDANESGNSLKLTNAKLARDNAIKIIQDNENKIIKIRDQINKINSYIAIFSTIVTIISSVPIPTSVPPGVGIPVNLIIKLVKLLDKANRILLSLSALIPILITILEKAIVILRDLKAQLLNINEKIEKAAISGIPGTESLLQVNEIEPGIENGNFPTEYKGFKFAIKEEVGSKAIVVKGYKRHYAVAIDTNNVEVLKSDLSYTLDPNDLIDQLKIIIDRMGLKDGNMTSDPNNPNNADNVNINGTSIENNVDSLIPPPSTPTEFNPLLSSLKPLTVTPPKPKEVTGPMKVLKAKVPLTLTQKASFTAQTLLPPVIPPGIPNPIPIDAAFILKEDVKWQADYKKYLKNIGGTVDEANKNLSS